MSNHIADASKMVSDTPRTDDHECDMFVGVSTFTPSDIQQAFDFARQLERELNAANDRIKRLEGESESRWLLAQSAIGSCEEMSSRIKRLEEAVDAYRKAYTPDGHVAPHDCFATGPKTGNPYQDLFACPGCWAERKAKEAKP